MLLQERQEGREHEEEDVRSYLIWKETKRYWKLTEAAVLDGAHRAVCRTSFGRRYKPAVRTGYVTMTQIYWYEPNQSRYGYHNAQSCTIYVFRVFDKIFTLSQIFPRRVLYFLCHFFLWRMVSEESCKSRYLITKMRAAVFLLIFCEQVRVPQTRSTEFAVSFDPDSEQVGESKPWTLTGKADSGMGTHKNYLRERSTAMDMPNNTAAYENPWPGGQWLVLHLACHQANQATANKRYNTTFLPRNDRPNPSCFSNSTGINPPWNAAHRVGVACIVFHYGLLSDVSCILYPAPAREHVPYTLHAAQAFLSSKYSPTWQKICQIFTKSLSKHNI